MSHPTATKKHVCPIQPHDNEGIAVCPLCICPRDFAPWLPSPPLQLVMGGSFLVQCPLDLYPDSQTHLYITPPLYLFMSYIRLISITDNTNKPINCFSHPFIVPFLCLLVCPRLPIKSPLWAMQCKGGRRSWVLLDQVLVNSAIKLQSSFCL